MTEKAQDVWDVIYKQYLDDLKTGDTVYPAYDAKSGRATTCKITATSEHLIRVEGVFWDNEDDCPIMIVFDKATGWAMPNADLPESEYLLLHPECFADPRHSKKYLQSLGFFD